MLNIDLSAIAGYNSRVQNWDHTVAQTNGGLNFPIFFLDKFCKSTTAADVSQYDAQKKVDGLYTSLSFGLDDTYFVEGTYKEIGRLRFQLIIILMIIFLHQVLYLIKLDRYPSHFFCKTKIKLCLG